MDKIRRTQETAAAWAAGRLSLARPGDWQPREVPGRPQRPRLVAARDLPQRGLGDAVGRAALIHAVAHIEFNAINLAWDAIQRFAQMPPDYFADWVQVAAEEAAHFELLRGRLQALGHDYGDFPAHDGLWDMAWRTADDVLARMALVPRVLEARGLDVTPGMMARLRAAGDTATADCLGLILADEVGHVAVGSRWFRYLCAERGLAPLETFVALIEQHLGGQVRGPFNRADRLRAGFDAAELDRLETLSGETRRRD